MRCPPVGDRVTRRSRFDYERQVEATVGPEKEVSLGIEARNWFGAGKKPKVIAPFSVLGLVVNDVAVDLDLTDGVVALEVGGIVFGVPEAKLNRGEDRQSCIIRAVAM